MPHRHDLETAVPEETDSPEMQSEGETSLFTTLTSQTPWWVISVLFHGLMIVLVGLASLTIEAPKDDEILLTTQYMPRTEESKQDPQKETKTGDALVPAKFDPSRAESNIWVADEFKAIAVEGSDFMTADLVKAEIEGARGTPDAKIMFNSLNPTDKAGGSGGGGSSYLEEMIGTSANANAGSGGGRFFGNGSGEGIGDGSGKGRFGRPNAGGREWRFKRYNPTEVGRRSKEWLTSVDAALNWLAYHQEADGHWDTKQYGAGNRCDVAMTSMSLLAFLGNGESEKVGPHKDNIKRAVDWLIKHQRADGMIVSDNDDQSTHRKGGYPMAIATLALSEAAAMANVEPTREAAQKAVDYCITIHQAGDGSDRMAWRYAPKMEGDLSVSGWFIMALKSARVAGLRVDHSAFDGAIRFLDSVEIKEKGGDVAYAPSHYKYMVNSEHPQSAHRLTAIGTLARQFMGWKKEDLQGSVDWFLEKGGYPAWGGNGEKVDLYYWYYASLAVFQQGEPQLSKWSKAMLDAFLPNQRKNGDEAGSWDPVGEFSGEWGRVGQTALSALCLEVYIRYQVVNK